MRNTTKGKLIALELVPEGDGHSALDVGCREGTQSRWLERHGYHVASIDIEKHYENALIADVNDGLPFADASYDLVWCSEVIEHLQSPEQFVAECERVLKPGGKLILTTPNSAFWLYPLARLFGKTPRDLQHDGHLHFFSLRDIRQLFPAAHIYGFFPYAIFRFRITRAIGLLSPTFVIEMERP
ncbi:MAG: class I SAM-dependent methyltransferase [Gammaproteobacteria bacterium]|nr:class I SAM-dependent methyltransferase [Gammaproteobacteria bacterium]NNF60354.1 class I SAM-dependent methyltransferase [Gammaproteobacteria bacterium]NNM20602.1 class I SAM-dependent methyltransferase [Gammaproteobacteria bacterium]